VAEAFGLGIGQQQKFVIYDNVELKIGATDVAYISGDSGSGKSVLLKAIKQDLDKEAIDTADIHSDMVLIDTIGKNLNKGLSLLEASSSTMTPNPPL
jgi:ABC-type transporter Mla maintaining outer membrane lipid asymmetry ATPase subunit MlaF